MHMPKAVVFCVAFLIGVAATTLVELYEPEVKPKVAIVEGDFTLESFYVQQTWQGNKYWHPCVKMEKNGDIEVQKYIREHRGPFDVRLVIYCTYGGEGAIHRIDVPLSIGETPLGEKQDRLP